MCAPNALQFLCKRTMANVDEKLIFKNLLAFWDRAEKCEERKEKIDQETIDGILETSEQLSGFADFRKKFIKCIKQKKESPGDDEHGAHFDESARENRLVQVANTLTEAVKTAFNTGKAIYNAFDPARTSAPTIPTMHNTNCTFSNCTFPITVVQGGETVLPTLPGSASGQTQ